MKRLFVVCAVFVSLMMVGEAKAFDFSKVSKGVSVNYSQGGSPDVNLSLSKAINFFDEVPVLNKFAWNVGVDATMYGANEDDGWEKEYDFGAGLGASYPLVKDISLGGSVNYVSLKSELNGMDKSLSGVKYGVSLSHQISENTSLSVGYSETKWDKDNVMGISSIEDEKTNSWGIGISYKF